MSDSGRVSDPDGTIDSAGLDDVALRTLADRAAPLSDRLAAVPPEGVGPTDARLAETRLQAWRGAVAGGDPAIFARRLAADGRDEPMAAAQLGATLYLRAEAPLPPWVAIFRECLAAPRTPLSVPDMRYQGFSGRPPGRNPAAESVGSATESAASTAESVASAAEPVGSATEFAASPAAVPFEAVLRPFARVAWRHLSERAAPDLLDVAPSACHALGSALLNTLGAVAVGPLLEAFTVYRAARGALPLPGAAPSSSRALYDAFVDALQGPTLADFFAEYSALARLLSLQVLHWVEATAELLHRLHQDLPEISRCFADGRPLGLVVGVHPHLSDPHAGGRTVHGVAFAGGLRLIYKPRRRAVDIGFANLLTFLNGRGLPLKLRFPRILARPDYAWVERLRPEIARSRRARRAWRRRVGMLACLTALLDGTDFHYQNVMTCGAHPVLVDVETLWQPRVLPSTAGPNNGATEETDDLLDAVRRTGLLPEVDPRPGRTACDVSGLTGAPGQITSLLGPVVTHVNQDGMALTYQPLRLPALPSSAPTDVAPERWDDPQARNDFLNGFAAIHRVLARHACDLVAADGALVAMASTPVRFIFRPTLVYNRLLLVSLQPQWMRDGFTRSLLFESLSRGLLTGAIPAAFWSLRRDEDAALERLEIPVFWTRPDARDVLLSEGPPAAACFDDGVADRVVRRLQALHPRHLKELLPAVAALLAAGAVGDDAAARPTGTGRPPGG